jgi:hypothetical protein
MNDHEGEKKTQAGGSSYLKQKVHVRKSDLCILVFGAIGVHLLAILLFADAGRWFSWLADSGGAAGIFVAVWSVLISGRTSPSDSSPTDPETTTASESPAPTPPGDE